MMRETTALEATRNSPTYRRRLEQGLILLKSWMPLALSALAAQSQQKVNGTLARFVQCMYDGKQKLWLVVHAILGFQNLFPQWRKLLQRPWDGIRSWKLKLKQTHRTPMPRALLDALFLECLDTSLVSGQLRQAWVEFAVLLRLMWHCLLRPGEGLRLRKRDLRFMQNEGSEVLVLGIARAKNAKFLGATQFAVCRCASTCSWVRWLTCDRMPWEKLFSSSAAMFSRMMKTVLFRFGVEHLGLTPASLRPGGATALYLAQVPIAELMFRGRWASMKSLASYIQEAMSLLVWSQISPELELEIQRRLARYSAVLAAAPTTPWRASCWQRRRKQ
jgi:hypothetical protein